MHMINHNPPWVSILAEDWGSPPVLNLFPRFAPTRPGRPREMGADEKDGLMLLQRHIHSPGLSSERTNRGAGPLRRLRAPAPIGHDPSQTTVGGGHPDGVPSPPAKSTGWASGGHQLTGH